MTGKVSEIKGAVSTKTDEFASSAQEATPKTASDAGQRSMQFAKKNSLLLAVLVAFGLGLLIGKARAR